MAAEGNRLRAPVADVLRLLDDRVARLGAERLVSVKAAGRVLANAVVAPVNVPGFDTAAMDGFAVRSDGTGPRRIAGAAWPGRPFAGEVGLADAVHITTGSPIPPGADCVVPVEVADERHDLLTLRVEAVRGKHIIRAGEDVAAGTEVLAAGRVLRPQDIGLLAAIGVANVDAVRRPRVAIIVTGDELLPAGTVPGGTQIVDSNSPMLAALIERDGGILATARHLPDDRAVLRDAIRGCDADAILISGGSSVGPEDHAADVVQELGELAVHGVAMKPGAPAGIGFIGSRIAFLLPGNPGACLTAYDLLASRAIRILGGRNREMPYRRMVVKLTTEIVSRVGRTDVVRVKLKDGTATPLASGPARLGSAVDADGFILAPHDAERLAAGTEVQVLRFDD